MKLEARDWAKYKVEDFTIEVGVPKDTPNEDFLGDEHGWCFTVRAKYDQTLYVKMLGRVYSCSPRESLDAIADCKAWIAAKIQRANEIIANEIGTDFEELVGTEYKPSDQERIKEFEREELPRLLLAHPGLSVSDAYRMAGLEKFLI
jgi:hypothetical protein